MKVVLGKLNDELLTNLAFRGGASSSEVHAAVAYAEGSEHALLKACKEKGLKLTFYGLLDERGAVGVPFLKELLSWGPSRAEVRLVKGNFHPKVIWWRGFGAYVGSANLTNNGWVNNVEAGMFLEEAELLSSGTASELDDLFLELQARSIAVTSEIVQRLERLARERCLLAEVENTLKEKFDKLFGDLPDNLGLSVVPPKQSKSRPSAKREMTWGPRPEGPVDVSVRFFSQSHDQEILAVSASDSASVAAFFQGVYAWGVWVSWPGGRFRSRTFRWYGENNQWKLTILKTDDDAAELHQFSSSHGEGEFPATLTRQGDSVSLELKLELV